jgi:RHS repeat-associated protein
LITQIELPDGSFIAYSYEGPLVQTIRRLDKKKKELYIHQITSRDLSGNILEEILPGALGKREQSFDEFGRITSIVTAFSNETASYDEDNNVKNRAIFSENMDDRDEKIYTTNLIGQITSIKTSDQILIESIYDIHGRRLIKKGEQLRRFFYIGETEIGALNEKGEIIELKIPSNPNNKDSPCIAIEIMKKVYIPLHDAVGNVTTLLDPEKGEIVETYQYSAYGETKGTSCVGNPWRYAGKRIDDETDLIYFGRRYYDPKSGRWISPNPLGPIDGRNFYRYSCKNPLY